MPLCAKIQSLHSDLYLSLWVKHQSEAFWNHFSMLHCNALIFTVWHKNRDGAEQSSKTFVLTIVARPWDMNDVAWSIFLYVYSSEKNRRRSFQARYHCELNSYLLAHTDVNSKIVFINSIRNNSIFEVISALILKIWFFSWNFDGS